VASAQGSSAWEEWRHHWPLVAATTAGMALAASLTMGMQIILQPLEEEFGWTRAEISSGPAVVSMMGLVLATPAGYLIDRLGARATGLVVIFTTFLSAMAIASIGDSLWHWWLAWAIFGIAGSFTSTVWMAPVSTVFSKGRGLAIAVTISGTGITGALVPRSLEYFVQNHGWRTGVAVISAVLCAITLVLVLAFVPRQGAAPKSKANGNTPAPRGPLTGLSPSQGFRSPDLWILFFASLLAAVTGVALILNLVPVLTSNGLTRADAVTVAGVMGVASIIGRLGGGLLMDRFDVRRLAIAASLVSTLFPLALLLFPGVFWAAMVGLIAYGLTGGMKMNAIVYLVTTHLGSRSFGTFYGMISITTTIAMGLAPMAANYIFDHTHSYVLVMWAAVPGFLGAGLLFFLLGKAPDFGPGHGAEVPPPDPQPTSV